MSDFTDKPSHPAPGNGPPPSASDLPTPQVTLPPAHPRGSLAITLVAASIVAALVAAVMVFGLQSFQGSVQRSNTLVQQGKFTLSADAPIEVYYPVPYTSPPHLMVTGAFPVPVVILEQKPDHFKVQMMKGSGNTTTSADWKAEGMPERGK